MTVCEQTGSENTFEHEFEREDQDTFKNKFPTLLLLLLSLSYSAFTVVSKKEKRATVLQQKRLALALDNSNPYIIPPQQHYHEFGQSEYNQNDRKWDCRCGIYLR